MLSRSREGKRAPSRFAPSLSIGATDRLDIITDNPQGQRIAHDWLFPWLTVIVNGHFEALVKEANIRNCSPRRSSPLGEVTPRERARARVWNTFRRGSINCRYTAVPYGFQRGNQFYFERAPPRSCSKPRFATIQRRSVRGGDAAQRVYRRGLLETVYN